MRERAFLHWDSNPEHRRGAEQAPTNFNLGELFVTSTNLAFVYPHSRLPSARLSRENTISVGKTPSKRTFEAKWKDSI
jgi:hypothetical protein